MRARSLARVAAVATIGAVATLATAAPALAAASDNAGNGWGVGMWLAVFLGIPVGLFVVIAALAVAPSMLRRPRYRPGRAWTAEPLWFSGPDDADAALRATRVGTTAKGGASAEW